MRYLPIHVDTAHQRILIVGRSRALDKGGANHLGAT